MGVKNARKTCTAVGVVGVTYKPMNAAISTIYDFSGDCCSRVCHSRKPVREHLSFFYFLMIYYLRITVGDNSSRRCRRPECGIPFGDLRSLGGLLQPRMLQQEGQRGKRDEIERRIVDGSELEFYFLKCRSASLQHNHMADILESHTKLPDTFLFHNTRHQTHRRH